MIIEQVRFGGDWEWEELSLDREENARIARLLRVWFCRRHCAIYDRWTCGGIGRKYNE